MTRTSTALADLTARAAVARDLASRRGSLVRDLATRTQAGWLRAEASLLVARDHRRRRTLESGRLLPDLP